jgi:DNA-binding transcriptional regulator PaaX
MQRSLRELAVAMGLPDAQVTAQVETLLAAASNEVMSREELQAATGIRHREHFRKAYIEPLVTSGWIQRTIPDKPTSRLQKYRLTDKGRAWLAGGKP